MKYIGNANLFLGETQKGFPNWLLYEPVMGVRGCRMHAQFNCHYALFSSRGFFQHPLIQIPHASSLMIGGEGREMSEYPFASLNLGRNGSREKLVPIYGAGLD